MTQTAPDALWARIKASGRRLGVIEACDDVGGLGGDLVADPPLAPDARDLGRARPVCVERAGEIEPLRVAGCLLELELGQRLGLEAAASAADGLEGVGAGKCGGDGDPDPEQCLQRILPSPAAAPISDGAEHLPQCRRRGCNLRCLS
jgi:hypothetical protein